MPLIENDIGGVAEVHSKRYQNLFRSIDRRGQSVGVSSPEPAASCTQCSDWSANRTRYRPLREARTLAQAWPAVDDDFRVGPDPVAPVVGVEDLEGDM